MYISFFPCSLKSWTWKVCYAFLLGLWYKAKAFGASPVGDDAVGRFSSIIPWRINQSPFPTWAFLTCLVLDANFLLWPGLRDMMLGGMNYAP
ncbi:hypothetical protein BKA81DRAFT_42270 [Phyllosticta paracitricarpa]